MAGGMRGGGGVPLSQRVRLDLDDDCPARHCWVAGAVDQAGVKRPGLLVEWRRSGDVWEGRVLYVARLRPDSWTVVEEWVAAALLTPR